MKKMQLNNFKQMDTKSGTTDIPACFDALVKYRYSLTSIRRYVVKLKKYSTFPCLQPKESAVMFLTVILVQALFKSLTWQTKCHLLSYEFVNLSPASHQFILP